MSVKKGLKISIFLIVSTLFIVFCFSFPYQLFFCFDDEMILTKDEWSRISDNNFLHVDSIEKAVSNSDGQNPIDEYIVKYNLFNLFNITSLKVKVVEDNMVYVGGDVMGFSLKSKGVVVVGGNYIITKDGKRNPMDESGFLSGDRIIMIDGKDINNVGDIGEILSACDGGAVSVVVVRNGKQHNLKVQPALDILTNSYKLGLWIKEDAVGVGTLTYIKPNDFRFGSLGHSINNGNTDEILEISDGNVYECNVIGVKRGKSGVPGELIGMFSQKDPQGNIDKNNMFGVFGYMDEKSSFLSGKEKIGVGGRMSARPGKATILSCIDGVSVEEYDIEIIKTNYQSSGSDKSMIFRVTDKELLQKTGGIVQGMSGSPIIQNGKIIGAVTHVFVNDPSKGSGLYIDWMLAE